jgi:TPR repeat protein
MNSLGCCFYNGKGTKKNHAKAFEFFEKSHQLGN